MRERNTIKNRFAGIASSSLVTPSSPNRNPPIRPRPDQTLRLLKYNMQKYYRVLTKEDYIRIQLQLRAIGTTSLLQNDSSDDKLHTPLYKILMYDAYKVFCNRRCVDFGSCKYARHGIECPVKEYTFYGMLHNWKANACLKICPLYHLCFFRQFVTMDESWKRMMRGYKRWRDKINGNNSNFIWIPALDINNLPYTIGNVIEDVVYQLPCQYFIERVVRSVAEEFEQGMSIALAKELGVIEGNLTHFKDNCKEGDWLVQKQIGYLLFMIEMGKMRLTKVKSITINTKSGEGFIPLVKDIQALIKDAVSLMDAHGWTSAGKKKLVAAERGGNRAKALDLLEGKDGVYTSEGEPDTKEENSDGNGESDRT